MVREQNKANSRGSSPETEEKRSWAELGEEKQWADGSAPVGEVKQFVRFKKVCYYEKTENGCVEITASQYAEKRGVNNAQDYRQAYNEIDEAAYSDESRKGRNLRHSSVIRDNGNAEILSRHSLGEELRNDVSGSISSGIGYNSSVSDSINSPVSQAISSGKTSIL